MELGSLLVLLGVILAVVALFVDNTWSSRLPIVALILVGIGVLVGASALID